MGTMGLWIVGTVTMDADAEVVPIGISHPDGGGQIFLVTLIWKVQNVDSMPLCSQGVKKMMGNAGCHGMLFQTVSTSSGSFGVSDV